MTDPSFIPTNVAIPLIIVLLLILLFMKIQDYRRLKAEAQSHILDDFVEVSAPEDSHWSIRTDTPLFDQLALENLSDENFDSLMENK